MTSRMGTATALRRPKQSIGPVLLFDERCAAYRNFAAIVDAMDEAGRLRIAPLQSLFGDVIRRTHREYANRVRALFIRADGSILAHSDAILAALEEVGGTKRR
jgi:predicted DCC family thiol-disulfide oxidoreductase YuxK